MKKLIRIIFPIIIFIGLKAQSQNSTVSGILSLDTLNIISDSSVNCVSEYFLFSLSDTVFFILKKTNMILQYILKNILIIY